MSSQSSLPAIPWLHETSDFGSVWLWETLHFVVTVNGDNRSCYFQISDRSADPAGPARPLSDGRAPTFEQAELLVRAAIGKAYDPALNYGRYAGPLATTFILATGQPADLGLFVGQEVTVVALTTDGTEQTFVGKPVISHYDFLLQTASATLRISPSYIVSVSFTGLSAPVATARRVNRTGPGKVEAGCTGRSGFMFGTVEHTGLTCPVHEESAAR